MKQIGTVVEIKGDMAKIECSRQSACDMCENAEHCVEKCKKVYATALNVVGASVGDNVEIETETGKVLKNAFLVFMVPIFLAVAAYYFSDLWLGEGVSVIITMSVLVFSVVLFSFLLNKAAKKQPVSRVKRIL